jgi:ankyrin repeat protein
MKRICGGLLVAALAVVRPLAAGGDTLLIDAVKAGDRKVVHKLLQRPAVLDEVQADGTTALHWAVRADDVEMVDLLVRAGAKVKVANRYGVTPLMLAATSGNPATLERLLKAGADARDAMPEGETVLMTAARSGNAEALLVLVEHGADVNAKEKWLGETALMWAAALDNANAVRVLLEHHADPDLQSNPTEFKKKVGGQTTLPRGGFTALMYAARQGAMDAARALVEAGADLNRTDPEGTNALVLAIINAHYDLAAMILEKGADPNIVDETGMGALYAAVDMNTLPFMHGRPAPKATGSLNSVDIVKALLARGANPNQVLKSAILRRHNSPGNRFLGAGATPLMRAARNGDLVLMRLLLDHGADPALKQADGTTLLMVAAGLGRRFDQNADALEYERATEEDLFRAVKFCVELGVDVNAANGAEETALHWAGGDAARLLVEHGARMDVKNKQGKTPLDLALARRDQSGRQLRPSSVTVLQELGAPTTGPAGKDLPAAP